MNRTEEKLEKQKESLEKKINIAQIELEKQLNDSRIQRKALEKELAKLEKRLNITFESKHISPFKPSPSMFSINHYKHACAKRLVMHRYCDITDICASCTIWTSEMPPGDVQITPNGSEFS